MVNQHDGPYCLAVVVEKVETEEESERAQDEEDAAAEVAPTPSHFGPETADRPLRRHVNPPFFPSFQREVCW